MRNGRRVRSASVIAVDDVLKVTANEDGVSVEAYLGFRSGAGGRDLSAYLCRRYTSATLAELSDRFGLSHPDSSSDMVKRAKKQVIENQAVARRMNRI